ncbi:tRNA adenosine(34) deaminase TadA [Thiomicrospira microaerophila]|uniref:tRNA adenosine(34) deaminase TadA n=1 Tax=Thiomicrospira microaerophila TaxID=406020 RepID=UPI00200D7919|nr:tRNA adenosine(34) deaminase TadA [Thiomicrospira microaerophila]UQB41608.1 tRNA adenosine(34) deaminase TadA [Thiomicrospira microaerophila]
MGVEFCDPEDLVGIICPPGFSQLEQDLFWMHYALALASYAERLGEVPVGALIVKGQKCLSVGYNQSINQHDPSGHAEMIALRSAGQATKNYRIPETTLYVTLEPCAMCATAMVHARVDRLVYGADDLKTGAAGSVFNLVNTEKLNHRIEVVPGVLSKDCSQQLSSFFKRRRLEKKNIAKQLEKTS